MICGSSRRRFRHASPLLRLDDPLIIYFAISASLREKSFFERRFGRRVVRIPRMRGIEMIDLTISISVLSVLSVVK